MEETMLGILNQDVIIKILEEVILRIIGTQIQIFKDTIEKTGLITIIIFDQVIIVGMTLIGSNQDIKIM